MKQFGHARPGSIEEPAFGRDTSPEAARIMVELMRSAPPEQKIRRVFELTRMARNAARVGLRKRHPGATSAEIERRLATLLYGETLAEAAYGPLEAVIAQT